jgi:DNA-binding HxlR family transcriptional regulator
VPTHSSKPQRSRCPISTALEGIGDRWTLVIVRDMVMGKKRFVEFLASPERITTNVLTDRLALMEQLGVVQKKPYEKRPLRFEYTLTPKGMGLLPVLQEMCRWANRHIPGTWIPPKSFMNKRAPARRR